MLLSDFKTMVTTELSDDTELVSGLVFDRVLSISGMFVLSLNYNLFLKSPRSFFSKVHRFRNCENICFLVKNLLFGFEQEALIVKGKIKRREFKKI